MKGLLAILVPHLHREANFAAWRSINRISVHVSDMGCRLPDCIPNPIVLIQTDPLYQLSRPVALGPPAGLRGPIAGIYRGMMGCRRMAIGAGGKGLPGPFEPEENGAASCRPRRAIPLNGDRQLIVTTQNESSMATSLPDVRQSADFA